MEEKKNYKLLWTLSYLAVYLVAFFMIEARPIDSSFHLLSSPLDKYFPFCEYFIIPYFIWFAYVPFVWFYLVFMDQKAFIPFTIFLFSGMTLFIIISLVYPNYLDLRVDFDADRNIFAKMCAALQGFDTPTNVFPSIHVFDSIAAHIGICTSSKLSSKKYVKTISFITMLLICLSTLFLKQHSFIDFAGGFILATILYIPIYILYPKFKKH